MYLTQIRPRRVSGGAGEGGGGGGSHLPQHWPSWAGTGKITIFRENPLKVVKMSQNEPKWPLFMGCGLVPPENPQGAAGARKSVFF